jgi:aminoglycoside phosphotransferase (APT) family kinase protein
LARGEEAAMPVPDPRDPEATRAALTEWLRDESRLPGAEITTLETPEFSGFSSEILMIDVADGGTQCEFAVRIAPQHYQVFPDVRFEEQYRLMRILAERTDIPVPPIRWYEPDSTYLGAPFFVMERIAGRVPTDMPPYHTGGWVTEISPGERSAMWWSGLEILARLHRIDPATLDVGFLDQPEWGAPGLDQRLGFYEHYMNWAYPGPKPTAIRALEWLKANRPAEEHPPVLLWGDARIGNMIFGEGGVPMAVLDWEAATFGQPEEDLAWYLYLDRHHSEGVYAERLDGFPTGKETTGRYEGLLGRPMRDMQFYEVLSGFKFTVIMSRIGQAMIEWDWLEGDSDFPYNNNASRLLDTILEGLS